MKIQFELNDRLRDLLEECKADNNIDDFQRALDEELVPYELLKTLSQNNVLQQPLAWYLHNTRITFRRPPAPESEGQRTARLAHEELLYRQMVGDSGTDRQSVTRTEQRELRNVLASISNALLSIVGVGVAVYLLAKHVVGWGGQRAVMAAVLSAVLVAVAEMYFFLRILYQMDTVVLKRPDKIS